MCDWLNDFSIKFKDYKEIQNLKQDNFHGSLVLNFGGNGVTNYDFKLHRRAVSYTENGSSPTETKGG